MTGARLLVVEDEPALLQGLVDVLAMKGYKVDSETTGPDGLARARAESYDLIILDVMLPGMTGFEVLASLRQAGRQTPVLLLTARNSELDKVRGFELGVDDYVTKPFSLLELLGRVQALLRRSGGGPSGARVLVFGDVRIDLQRYTATEKDTPLSLPAKAFDLLKFLADRQGQAVTRDAIMDAVWGTDGIVNERTVNNLVLKLRQAIHDDGPNSVHLKSVHGIGYRLDLPT